MAGGGDPTPAKSGKKSVDFTVNLVPTIDLLSVLIAFLLITAVWTELARINAQQVLPKTTDKPAEDTEQEEKKKFYVFVTETDITLMLTGEKPEEYKPEDGKDAIVQAREAVTKYKERITDPKIQVLVGASDAVRYNQLIDVMDVMLDAGLSNMSIGDANVVKGQMKEPLGGEPGEEMPTAPQPG